MCDTHRTTANGSSPVIIDVEAEHIPGFAPTKSLLASESMTGGSSRAKAAKKQGVAPSNKKERGVTSSSTPVVTHAVPAVLESVASSTPIVPLQQAMPVLAQVSAPSRGTLVILESTLKEIRSKVSLYPSLESAWSRQSHNPNYPEAQRCSMLRAMAINLGFYADHNQVVASGITRKELAARIQGKLDELGAGIHLPDGLTK